MSTLATSTSPLKATQLTYFISSGYRSCYLLREAPDAFRKKLRRSSCTRRSGHRMRSEATCRARSPGDVDVADLLSLAHNLISLVVSEPVVHQPSCLAEPHGTGVGSKDNGYHPYVVPLGCSGKAVLSPVCISGSLFRLHLHTSL